MTKQVRILFNIWIVVSFFYYSTGRSQNYPGLESRLLDRNTLSTQPADFDAAVRMIEETWANHLTHPWILVDSSDQRLYLIHHGKASCSWPVSTAKNGMGNSAGSEKTPLGAHCIYQKIGDGTPPGTIFKGRINTGSIAEIHTGSEDTEVDFVTTRILWLSGLEPGKNNGDSVDSKNRLIYIHGTDEEGKIGAPASHGCIRMTNKEIILLFKKINTGCFVYIQH